jgi:hypothetical protein
VYPLKALPLALAVLLDLGSARQEAVKTPGQASEGPQYGVRYLPGDIERVILTNRDDAQSLCIQVTLNSPGDLEAVPSARLQLPPGWSLQRAIAVRDVDACRATTRRRPAGAIDATEVAGSVRWGNSPTDRTEVDLRLSFPARGAAPAFTERLKFKR